MLNDKTEQKLINSLLNSKPHYSFLRKNEKQEFVFSAYSAAKSCLWQHKFIIRNCVFCEKPMLSRKNKKPRNIHSSCHLLAYRKMSL